ncbi:unannotated protein [freshwater metagenome]|uniref:Unannotated protein n=1 Tax=freshwater metagenome TaxID=449393 RepID=A0A6J6GDP7_9ZZZZ
MCSVRQSPTPSAPKIRALIASSGVSALARTSSRRILSACVKIRSTALTTGDASSLAEDSKPSKYEVTGDATTGSSPR